MKRYSQTLTVVVEAETAAMAATTVSHALSQVATLSYHPPIVNVYANQDQEELDWEPGAPLQTLEAIDPQLQRGGHSPAEYSPKDVKNDGANAEIDPARPENRAAAPTTDENFGAKADPVVADDETQDATGEPVGETAESTTAVDETGHAE